MPTTPTPAPTRAPSLPGLRFKFFTLDDDGRRARNVYVLEDDDAGRQFFSAEMVEQVTGAYGIQPTIEYADIVATVDNSR